jgi:hypothetical membrane protein
MLLLRCGSARQYWLNASEYRTMNSISGPNYASRFAIFCGIAAPIWFVAALMLFAALRPEYSHLTKAVSELGALGTPNALAWNLLGFGAVGAMVMAFAVGFGRIARSWASMFTIGISGLGFAAAGLFPADMSDLQSTITKLHIASSILSFAGFISAVVVVGWTLWRRCGWPRFAGAATIFGVIAIASVVAREFSIPTGLAQRINFVAYLLWVAIVAGGVCCLTATSPGRNIADPVDQ